jgi:hypothetical protein
MEVAFYRIEDPVGLLGGEGLDAGRVNGHGHVAASVFPRLVPGRRIGS